LLTADFAESINPGAAGCAGGTGVADGISEVLIGPTPVFIGVDGDETGIAGELLLCCIEWYAEANAPGEFVAKIGFIVGADIGFAAMLPGT
jgi:hypothetical protein